MAAQLKHGIPANCGVLALTAGQDHPRPRAPHDVAWSYSSPPLPQDPGELSLLLAVGSLGHGQRCGVGFM